ncbi:MAG: hypothetical protein IKK02_01350 [Tidjanibacter sp.]|nr:hypothetical protein [Tidjanibacter sp.]
MEAIDKLLYNLLSSGESVVLPEVGTLRVEQSATTQSGNRVVCGSRRVRFSSRTDKGVRSVVSVMVEEYGLSNEEATEAYGEWLRSARKGPEVTIEGVGSVKKGFFKPTEEFDSEALNPWQTAPVTLHSRRLPLGWIFTICVVLGAAGAWMWLVGGGAEKETAKEIAKEVDSVITEEAIVASLEEYAEELEVAPTPEEKVEIKTEEKVEVKPEQIPAPKPEQKPTPKPTPAPQQTQPKQVAPAEQSAPAVPAAIIPIQPVERTSGKSVVVAGVFSTGENADKFIAEDELGVGSAAYSKHHYGSKILVAVGGIFDTATAANTHRRTLPSTDGSLWVYTFK